MEAAFPSADSLAPLFLIFPLHDSLLIQAQDESPTRLYISQRRGTAPIVRPHVQVSQLSFLIPIPLSRPTLRSQPLGLRLQARLPRAIQVIVAIRRSDGLQRRRKGMAGSQQHAVGVGLEVVDEERHGQRAAEREALGRRVDVVHVDGGAGGAGDGQPAARQRRHAVREARARHRLRVARGRVHVHHAAARVRQVRLQLRQQEVVADLELVVVREVDFVVADRRHRVWSLDERMLELADVRGCCAILGELENVD